MSRKYPPHQILFHQLVDARPDLVIQNGTPEWKTPCLVLCNHCGCEFKDTPKRLLDGAKCPTCSSPGARSVTEQMLYLALSRMTDDEILQNDHTAIPPKELDIYCPEGRWAVEYGSWCWHAHKLDKDAKKAAACKQRGIRLIVIYDNAPKNAKVPFKGHCFTVRESLRSGRSYSTMRSMLGQICHLTFSST